MHASVGSVENCSSLEIFIASMTGLQTITQICYVHYYFKYNLGDGNSYFVEHLLMAASEKIKFFYTIHLRQEQISNLGIILILSNVKRIQASNHMLKEPIEVSFFAIQANFPFTDTNFTKAKFDKTP